MNLPNRWTILGYLVGSIMAIGSYWHYWVIYTDLSQGVLYIFAGATICAFAFLYEVSREHKDELDAIGDKVQDHNLILKEKGLIEVEQ